MSAIQNLEAKRLAEQQRIDDSKCAGERNRLGQFATPPGLARDIVKHVRSLWQGRQDRLRFFDPAIGTGSFFSALKDEIADGLIERAAGIEIDRDFAATARDLWQEEGLEVTDGDFTTMSPRDKHDRFNLILTNPPYVRHHHLAKGHKEQLKATVYRELGIDLSGLSGLYCYFLLLADKWLADDGIGIWLIPSEFMAVNYGDAVKRYLLEHVKLLQIHRFCPSDVQFSDALVSSAIVVFQKSKERAQSAQFSFGGPISSPDKTQYVSVESLGRTRKWTQFPGSLGSADEKCRLGDFFAIKRGIATGANNYFILPRSKANALGIPRQFQKPILPSPRFLPEAIIEADPDGYPRIENPLSLIDCDVREKEIQREHPEFYAYLNVGKKSGIHELYLTSRRSPWYAQERRKPAPFLCTYMGRASTAKKPFRFIWNKSNAITANVYLLLYPKASLQMALIQSPELAEGVFSFLNSITLEMLLDESRVYGGGLFKLEPKELARVPADSLASAIGDFDTRRQMSLFT